MSDAGEQGAGGANALAQEVSIPDIGDAEDVEVIEICVAPGDTVAENDALIVIESDKASMEVPAPFAGTVAEVLVALSDRVNAGDAILRLDAAAPKEAEVREDPAPQSEAEPVQSEPKAEPAPPKAAPATSASPPVLAAQKLTEQPTRVYAGPAVRRLARELGVDLRSVVASGDGGRIVKDDVKAFVKQVMTAPSATHLQPMEAIDYSRFGAIEIAPLTRIRERGAANLHRSWQHVVHVTQHDEADVTDLEAFRASLREEAEAHKVKLTPLPLIVKACIHVLRVHPHFNASLNPAVSALVHKRYYHIGIAVDTQDGLVVPVVRDADKLRLFELAEKIAALSQAAREKKLRPDDLQGGSFTISSLGAIGGTGFTPIVNAPEVAILGVARMDLRPVWTGDSFRPRKMLPLSLSYDHRAINGAEGGRFMADLVATLGDIRRLIL